MLHLHVGPVQGRITDWEIGKKLETSQSVVRCATWATIVAFNPNDLQHFRSRNLSFRPATSAITSRGWTIARTQSQRRWPASSSLSTRFKKAPRSFKFENCLMVELFPQKDFFVMGTCQSYFMAKRPSLWFCLQPPAAIQLLGVKAECFPQIL